MTSDLPHSTSPTIYLALFVAGTLLGSFLGVVSWRVPRNQSIVLPRSACPRCNHTLQPLELLPVLSFLILKGRCHHCRQRIPLRYPLIEIATGVILAAVFYRSNHWQEFVVWSVLFSLLLAMSVIDIEHQRLPNSLNLLGTGLGLLWSLLSWSNLPLQSALFGAGLGLVLLLAMVILSGGGMGMGDAKLLAMIGTYHGPVGVLYTLFVGSVVGLMIGGVLLSLRRIDRQTPIPFGPFLALGAALVWFLRP